MAKELDSRNKEITIKIAKVLNELKDFEAGYSPDPKMGRMIVKFKDNTFFLDIEPIYQDNERGRELEKQSFDDIYNNNVYHLRR